MSGQPSEFTERPEPKRYVVGYLFWRDNVLLVRKIKPEWQRGLLNGIGGHVERDEEPFDAILREFEEEVGRPSPADWVHFATIAGEEPAHRKGAPAGPFEVWIFKATIEGYFPPPQKNDIGEPVAWFPIHALVETIPNVRWLIPMARLANQNDFPYLIRERARAAE